MKYRSFFAAQVSQIAHFYGALSRGDLLSGTSSSSKAFSVSEKTSSSSSSNSSVSFRNFIHFENCLYRLNFQKYIRANPTAAEEERADDDKATNHDFEHDLLSRFFSSVSVEPSSGRSR